MDRVDLSVEGFCSTDNSWRGVHIEEAFQVSVSVNRVPANPSKGKQIVMGQVWCCWDRNLLRNKTLGFSLKPKLAFALQFNARPNKLIVLLDGALSVHWHHHWSHPNSYDEGVWANPIAMMSFVEKNHVKSQPMHYLTDFQQVSISSPYFARCDTDSHYGDSFQKQAFTSISLILHLQLWTAFPKHSKVSPHK